MAKIPQEKIEEIRTAADIVSYISRYVSLKKTGKNFKGLCPFHKEKTPSFIVSPEKQLYHCFGCGKGGNLLGFLMEIEKISYIEAIRKVAFDLGIPLPIQSYEKSEQEASEFDALYSANKIAKDFYVAELYKVGGSQARNYIKKRRFKPETIKKYEIGIAPGKWDSFYNEAKHHKLDLKILTDLGLIQKKETGNDYFDKFRNRIMFPFHNISGHIVGFGGRRLVETDQPKYLNSPESKIYKKGEILYGLYQAIPAIRENQMVILVEGYFDLLRLVDVAIENVVASSGTALTEAQGRLLKRITNSVIISYDSDEAGIKAALRNSYILESLGLDVYILEIPVPHDPDSYILNEGKNAYLELIKKKITPIEFQLRNFKSLYPLASIEDKNRFIDELLENLTQLPNDVKVGLNLHLISEHLQIAETFLISRFNRLKKQRKYQTQPIFSSGEEEEVSQPFRRGQWRAEEGIISLLLLNEPQITKIILHQVSASDFENDDLRALFEFISLQWEEMGKADLKSINNKFSSKDEQTLLSKLYISEINNSNKFAADCIYKLRKRSLDLRFNELKRLMNEESSSHDSILHYMRELNAIRNKLSEIEQEHARYFKLDL